MQFGKEEINYEICEKKIRKNTKKSEEYCLKLDNDKRRSEKDSFVVFFFFNLSAFVHENLA